MSQHTVSQHFPVLFQDLNVIFEAGSLTPEDTFMRDKPQMPEFEALPFLTKEFLHQSDVLQNYKLDINAYLHLTVGVGMPYDKFVKGGAHRAEVEETLEEILITALTLSHRRSTVISNKELNEYTLQGDTQDEQLKRRLSHLAVELFIPIKEWNSCRTSAVELNDRYPVLKMFHDSGEDLQALRRVEYHAMMFTKALGGKVGRKIGGLQWMLPAENWEHIQPLDKSAQLGVSRPLPASTFESQKVFVMLSFKTQETGRMVQIPLVDIAMEILMAQLSSKAAKYCQAQGVVAITKQLQQLLDEMLKAKLVNV